MATTTRKKTVEKEDENDVVTTVDETVEDEPVVVKPATKEKEMDEKDKQIKALQDQIAALFSMIAAGGIAAPEAAKVNNSTAKNSLSDEITIVHLKECGKGFTTHIKLSTITLDFSRFGEERTIYRSQFEELVGSYRRFFEQGVIALGDGFEDLAEKYGIKAVSQYGYLTPDFYNNIMKLNSYELEEVFKKLSKGHKAFVLEYFNRKIIEGDPRVKDSTKIELLNRLSGGAMQGAVLDSQKISTEIR